jgi:methylphosphotriester-DNA--protein-cysteine methyltransferase
VIWIKEPAPCASALRTLSLFEAGADAGRSLSSALVQSRTRATLIKASSAGEYRLPATRFVRAIGCSPMVALRQMRMKRAADMLAAKTFSVEQIARAVGYRSGSSFLRAFRQVHGYVPAESEGEGRSAHGQRGGSGAAEDEGRDT